MRRTLSKLPGWYLILRSLLAACLACLVAGNGLLGLAHFAFSDHRHAFCDEHGQVEDIPKLASVRQVTDQAPVNGTTGGASPSPFAAHTACVFLNGRAFQAPAQHPEEAPSVAPTNQLVDQSYARQPGVGACPLLLSAPKTSPPFVAV